MSGVGPIDRRRFMGLGAGLVALPWVGCAAKGTLAPVPGRRARLRDLGIAIGSLGTGIHNAITDVEGVLVGHATLIEGEGPLVVGQGPVRNGVTVILPHGGDLSRQQVMAAPRALTGKSPCVFAHMGCMGKKYAFKWHFLVIF